MEQFGISLGSEADLATHMHDRSRPMAATMRTCSLLIVGSLGCGIAVGPAKAQRAVQCVVSGSPPAGWGFNSVGYIEIGSGTSCMFSINITGEISSSSVSQNPAHGTLQQIDLSSFLYTSAAGYSGRDTFSVQANGMSQTGKGTSVITISATLQ
jgi:hypothetical protein